MSSGIDNGGASAPPAATADVRVRDRCTVYDFTAREYRTSGEVIRDVPLDEAALLLSEGVVHIEEAA